MLERRRAKTSENISAAVLSNLSSGVVFFTPNGLVRQANHFRETDPWIRFAHRDERG